MPKLEIFDRVGGGDSFASGLIYGFLAGKGPQWAVECGCAHGALAMTTPGDTDGDTGGSFACDEGGDGARATLARNHDESSDSRANSQSRANAGVSRQFPRSIRCDCGRNREGRSFRTRGDDDGSRRRRGDSASNREGSGSNSGRRGNGTRS